MGFSAVIACYDLSRCPPTYDAVSWLAHAELERLRRGEEHVDVHVLPGPAGGFRRDSLWPRSVEERVHLRERVLVPLLRMLPAARSVTVDSDRSAEGWGKGEYYAGLGPIARALAAGCRPLRATSGVDFYGITFTTPIMTLTLREAAHHPKRNSRTDEWALAADELADAGATVFIIRDTLMADVPLVGSNPRVRQLRLPAVDLEARAALYAAADLNVGISNGPLWMSVFMDAPTLMLRPTTNEARGCYDDAFFARHGVRRGGQLPSSPPHQRLVWEEDTAQNIVRAVREMLAEVYQTCA